MKKKYKKSSKRYQNLSKEEKHKNDNMVMSVTKIFQKMKSKSLLSIEKNIINEKICFIIIIRKYFSLGHFASLLGKL